MRSSYHPKGGDRIPCPHFDLKIIGRSKKHRSAIASAAYQSGDKLFSESEHRQKSYPDRGERILYTEILLPDHAPKAYADRQTLWNAVERVDKASGAQFARRFVLMLPRELSDEENLAFLRKYCQEQFVSQGMIADIAFHYDHQNNPHAHVLTTMRPMDEQGNWACKGRKVYDLNKNGQHIRLPSGRWKSHKERTTDWDDRGNCEKWRHEWEVMQNSFLEQANRPERVDLRSYERQGNDMLPTVHLGPEASALGRRGIKTCLGDRNREIRKTNALVRSIGNNIQKLREWIADLKAAKRQHEEKQQSLGPPLRKILQQYIDSRSTQRKDWHSNAKLQGITNDWKAVRPLIDYLYEKEIWYAPDMLQLLNGLEARAQAANEILQRNHKRQATIGKIEAAAATIIRLQPIHDAYAKKFFKGAKEKYAEEHADELKESRRAYAFLMKNHSGELAVSAHEFDRDNDRMSGENATARAELATIHDDLETLRKVRNFVRKVDPELIGEKKSLEQQMEEAQTAIRMSKTARSSDTKRQSQEHE